MQPEARDMPMRIKILPVYRGCLTYAQGPDVESSLFLYTKPEAYKRISKPSKTNKHPTIKKYKVGCDNTAKTTTNITPMPCLENSWYLSSRMKSCIPDNSSSSLVLCDTVSGLPAPSLIYHFNEGLINFGNALFFCLCNDSF